MNSLSCLHMVNVTAGYSGKAVLLGIELSVPMANVVGLIGPNGAGKSTLLRAILGLVAVTEGEIRFRGKCIQNGRPSSNVRSGIAYLQQGAPAFVELTVRQNLLIGGVRLSRTELNRKIDEILALFSGLGNRLHQRAGLLSGGERQMLGLARALIAEPKLLLLDEPSTGLHPDVSAVVFETLRQLAARGISILIVEQNIKQVLQIASRVYALKQGIIVEFGDPQFFPPRGEIKVDFPGVISAP